MFLAYLPKFILNLRCLLGLHSEFLNRNASLRIYKQNIVPILDYAGIVWLDCGKQNSQCLERLQNHAMRIILSSRRLTCDLAGFFFLGGGGGGDRESVAARESATLALPHFRAPPKKRTPDRRLVIPTSVLRKCEIS